VVSSLEWANTPVYLFASIAVKMVIRGPALVVDKTQTLLVGPGSTARIVGDKLVIDVSLPRSHNISTAVLDPVALSVFRHRFMGVAEQMGRVLQNGNVLTSQRIVDVVFRTFGACAASQGVHE